MRYAQRFKRAPRRLRKGASAVEFAVIAPLMIAFTFGLVEVGRIMLVKQSATHASREGARVGVRPTATSSDVTDRVQEELAILGIDSGSVTVTPASIEDSEPGSRVTVRVEVPIDTITWIPGVFTFGVSDITAESSMRRESTQ